MNEFLGRTVIAFSSGERSMLLIDGRTVERVKSFNLKCSAGEPTELSVCMDISHNLLNCEKTTIEELALPIHKFLCNSMEGL